MEQYPKLLIISHNLYDVNNNIGKTLISLLKGWPVEKISQINFRNDPPSFNYCKEYYSITDKEALFSAIPFSRKKAGRIIETHQSRNLGDTEKALYQFGNHRYPIVGLIRDNVWKHANWKTKELTEWIKNVAKPDLILFVPNDYCLAYEVCNYVCKITDKPIIPFYMDDAFYWKQKSSAIDQHRRKQLLKWAKKIHTYRCNKLFTICDAMSEEYEKLFDLKCYAFVNSVPIPEKIENKLNSEVSTISYSGNLHSNRWKSLVEVGKAIDKINHDTNRNMVLQIFTLSTPSKKAAKEFEQLKCIKFMGTVSLEQLKQGQLESDILLYAEAFDRRSYNNLRLSMSTKIPEYLGTGRSILAYGPKGLASIRYLKSKKLAEICTNKEQLVTALLNLIDHEDYRNQLGIRARKEALEKYDIERESQEFKALLKDEVAI